MSEETVVVDRFDVVISGTGSRRIVGLSGILLFANLPITHRALVMENPATAHILQYGGR